VAKREVSLIFQRLVDSICRCCHDFCCMTDRCCWGPSASEGPQKQDLTVFLEYNV
jgi:hypothetical protein